MAEKQYLLGSDEQQAWMRDYFFAPRGIGFTEPGTVGLDSAEFSAYNVAKSFYQNYPEVFNIAMIREKTDLAAEEIIKRLKRMYDEHLIMFVMNPAVARIWLGTVLLGGQAEGWHRSEGEAAAERMVPE